MVCLSLPLYAGIKIKDTAGIAQQTQQHNIIAYKQDGSVEVESLLNIAVNNKISFKLEDTIVTGTVTEINTSQKNEIVIVGVFSKEDKSGFVFRFCAPNTIGGVLFFAEKGVVYNLKHNDESGVFFFEKQEIKLRENTDTNIKKKLIKTRLCI